MSLRLATMNENARSAFGTVIFIAEATEVTRKDLRANKHVNVITSCASGNILLCDLCALCGESSFRGLGSNSVPSYRAQITFPDAATVIMQQTSMPFRSNQQIKRPIYSGALGLETSQPLRFA